MPIRKVPGGYQWGQHGKVYADRGGAERQAQAAYANGYKGDSNALKQAAINTLNRTRNG